jgi:glycosyltransferase involved in cell wall biosynthesis
LFPESGQVKFSIAIPIYQQANFLPSALESIRVQALDVQLAVVDATPDDSVQNKKLPG